MNDFKNAKKFWKFYSPLVKIKSDKSSNGTTINIKVNEKIVDEKEELCDIFNNFFTTIKSSSNVPIENSIAFINDNFANSNSNFLPDFKFSFNNSNEINDSISDLNYSSGAGVCGIPTMCLKNSSFKFKSIIAYLLNFKTRSQ
ncbi:unnamed protein product [Brachionus calyciflorus]|uniref:Uncharacterized protein n=1 Tax=Brachionus calyciflorus TaxID=104777 RepID=A0A813Z7L1_9BILA|nr:unnamed protein product [Brachionus calyciflorus]